MSGWTLFKVLLITVLTQVIRGEVTTVTCEVIENVPESDFTRAENYLRFDFISTNLCILQGLNMTSLDKHFLPIPNHSVTDIDAVRIEKSKVEVLTGDICKTMPFIKVFGGASIGLRSIEENAFKECTKLERILLQGNFLSTLSSQIFHWNPELTEVRLWKNELTEIDENLFENNKKLTEIDLSENLLDAMPMNLFQNTKKLTKVLLTRYSNKLNDLSFIEEVRVLKTLTLVLQNDSTNVSLVIEPCLCCLKSIWKTTRRFEGVF